MICMLGSATCQLTRMKPHHESATLEQSSARALVESQLLCVCRSGFLKASRACTLRCAVRTAFHPTCSDQTALLVQAAASQASGIRRSQGKRPKLCICCNAKVQRHRRWPSKADCYVCSCAGPSTPFSILSVAFSIVFCLGLCEGDLDHEIS